MEEENPMKMVINGLIEATKKQRYETYGEDAIALFDKYGEQLYSPSTFNILIQYEDEQKYDVLLQLMNTADQIKNKRTYTEKQLSNIKMVYEHYSIISHHLDKLIEETEGHACSHDKTTIIISDYLRMIKLDKEPVWDDRSQYYTPNYGKPSVWMKFVESIIDFAYGQSKPYMDAREALIESIAEDTNEKRIKTDEEFKKHPFYVETKEIDEDGQTPYIFLEKDVENPITLNLFLSKNGTISYNARNTSGKNISRDIHMDTPNWIKELFKT